MSRQPDHRPTENLILAALPAHEYHQLRPHLKPVTLALGQVLYDADEPIRLVYFLTSGMTSLLSITAAGEAIEVAMVGNEGMLGTPLIWGSGTAPYQVMVQFAGAALTLKAALLKEEFQRQGRLHDLLLRHTHALVSQIAQSAVCNRFHTVEQRLCRWLLITNDRTNANEFSLTQDFLSHMLGSGRQRVNAAVRALQHKRLIRYVRGQITILDRRGIEATSCECYDRIKPAYADRLYSSENFSW